MPLIPFDIGHLDSFLPGDRERPLVETADMAFVARHWHGKAISLVDADTGRCLGIAGVGVTGGVGRASLLLSDELRAHPVTLHRAIVRSLWKVMAHFNLHRMEVTVHPDDEAGIRWLERMGFRFDTALPDYLGSGVTFWRYGLDRH